MAMFFSAIVVMYNFFLLASILMSDSANDQRFIRETSIVAFCFVLNIVYVFLHIRGIV